MAVRVNGKHSDDHKGDISNCVSSLIQAFSNGLNIFARLRERRQKRKARKQSQSVEPMNSAELQLSNSLRRGPVELAEKYEECYMQKNMGRNFARGDPIAHSSLAETLIRLNTGLVGIITAFLNHDSCNGNNGSGNLKLDYNSLTNLSDASRREALQCMTSLYQRLSMSQLQIQPILCSICGSENHSNCSEKRSGEKVKKRRTGSRQRSNGPIVARMPIKRSSDSQLVVVRPKQKKKGSSDGGSNASKSTSSSAYTSPLSSPVPEHSILVPFTSTKPDTRKNPDGSKTPPSVVRKRVDSFEAMRSTPCHPKQDYTNDVSKPKLPAFELISRNPEPQRPKASSAPSTLPYSPVPLKRRAEKPTPSSYTFASDSTKLGEIPERKWITPWNYEEAARLNDKAAMMLTVVVPEEKVKAKKGLARFWR